MKRSQFNTGDKILTVLFCASVGLTVWAVSIYRLTIIEAKYLLAAIAVGIGVSFGVLTFFIASTYSTFWTAFIKIGIGAGIFSFGLLFLNKQFADKEILTRDFRIIKTGSLARGGKSTCSQPYAIVDFYGTEKQLVFYCDFLNLLKHSSKVSLTYSKGAFGFNVIKSQTLIN